MPSKRRPPPLYQRGGFALHSRPGRANLEIVWYDHHARRERSRSAGTASVPAATAQLDRLYLETSEGQGRCPTCGAIRHDTGSALVTAAIADALILDADKPSYDAIRARLAHVTLYVVENDPAVRVDQVDEAWIGKFLKWALAKPIVSPTGKIRPRTPSTVENSVIQLAAVINRVERKRGRVAQFRPIPTKELNATPLFRPTVEQMAAMFRYCLYPDKPTPARNERAKREREQLLRFLRAAVATWARPDAIMDISTAPERRQWHPASGTLALNPHGRRQTRKHRATIPVARQFVPDLDAASGPYITVGSIKSAWNAMARAIGLPGDGEAGTKLIRRAMAHLVRAAIGEEHWVQGKAFLGHHKDSTSDLYALRQSSNLGLALAATESVIDQIEMLVPGAFYRNFTALSGKVFSIKGANNG